MRVILLLAVCLSAQLLPAIAVARLPPPPDNTVWTGIETVDGLELHGRGWPLAAMPANASFTRLPASAKGCCAMDNGEVWDLAQSPSGLKVTPKRRKGTTNKKHPLLVLLRSLLLFSVDGSVRYRWTMSIFVSSADASLKAVVFKAT